MNTPRRLAPLLSLVAACASAPAPRVAIAAASPATPTSAAAAPAGATSTSDVALATGNDEPSRAGAAWIGAAAEGDVLLAGATETSVGIWVDTPRNKPRKRVPVDVALVVDTSGSMAGAKIDAARSAARTIVDSLADGDVVSVDTFSDDARSLVEPTTLSAATRPSVLSHIESLRPSGGTNMFDGLALGESHVARAPSTHGVRRVVMISDGIANVGPSSPEALGALAERGLRVGAQVTSLGVGTEYDERTLNALAQKTTGRLYHLAEPREMASMLRREMDLLTATVAADAFVEVVPAPGVDVVDALGVRIERAGGSVKLPLGALFAGQHREALVKVRLRDTRSQTAPRALASVRLHFRDPDADGLERVQEVAVRSSFSSDPTEVARHASAQTRTIAAVMDAGRLQVAAAADVTSGDVRRANDELAVAQKRLEKEAAEVADEGARTRLVAAAKKIESSRAAFAPSAAPMAKPAARQRALDMNAAGMASQGY